MIVVASFFSGCCSTPQTYPTPYGSAFPVNTMQGVPINSGTFAPPSINTSAMPAGAVPQGFAVTPPPGTIPQGAFPTQTMPVGNMQTGNMQPSLPPFGSPQTSFPAGYPQTGYPQNGYPQGVPLNTMIPPSQPFLFGR
jgi:hypothetical protein